MSTRMEYQRLPGFGTSRASIKAGLSYERKVTQRLMAMADEGAFLDFELSRQHPIRGGYVDLALSLQGEPPRFLIEIKSQWSLDAYKQLLRYGGGELSSSSRVCICKTYHPHVPIPEPVICKPLHLLLEAPRGSLTVIPWSGR